MVSTVQNSFERGAEKQKQELSKEHKVKDDEVKDDEYINPPDAGGEFDFVEAYDDEPIADDELLPENTAVSAINCAFIGVGGGGGKLAKAFLDLGFNKTLLVNTTLKDLPTGIDDQRCIIRKSL